MQSNTIKTMVQAGFLVLCVAGAAAPAAAAPAMRGGNPAWLADGSMVDGSLATPVQFYFDDGWDGRRGYRGGYYDRPYGYGRSYDDRYMSRKERMKEFARDQKEIQKDYWREQKDYQKNLIKKQRKLQGW